MHIRHRHEACSPPAPGAIALLLRVGGAYAWTRASCTLKVSGSHFSHPSLSHREAESATDRVEGISSSLHYGPAERTWFRAFPCEGHYACPIAARIERQQIHISSLLSHSSHQMRREQEIRNPLPHRILMPTIPANQRPAHNLRLQQ